MSIFSSKKKTFVGLTTVPLIPEQSFFNESVLAAILSNGNIGQSLAAELRNGWIGKAERFYRDVKKLNNNAGTAVYTTLDNRPLLENTLISIFGFNPEIFNSFLGEYDVTYTAYEHILSNYTIDLETDTVTGFTTESVIFESAELNNNNTITINYLKSDNSIVSEVIENPYNFSGTVYHLIYANPTTPTVFNVWFYDTTTSLYPDLVKSITYKTYTDYYPSILIRKDKVNTVDLNTDYATSAIKIMKRMGVDMSFVTEQIMSDENGNDSDVIDDAFFTFGLNIQDNYAGSREYLYKYFDAIYEDNVNSKSEFDNWLANPKGTKPENSIKYIDNGFNVYLGWNYITKERRNESFPYNFKYSRGTLIRPKGKAGGTEYEQSTFQLYKYIDENTYELIIVHGLYHVTDIINGKYVLRTLADSLKVPDNDTTDDSGFYIPISRTLVNSLSFISRKQVLYASFIMPLYTIQVVTIKWYQRGAFRIVLLIVAIIITIYFDYSGSALEIALSIASNVAVSVILNYALQFVVDILGVEATFVIALVATAIAIYNGGYSTNGVPWAQELLQLTIATFSAISSEIADQFVKLENEMSDFISSAKEKQEEIEAAAALLDNSKFSYLDIKRGGLYFNPYETPDQFYNRSIYDQNPGVKTFDLLYNYVDRMLQLPQGR